MFLKWLLIITLSNKEKVNVMRNDNCPNKNIIKSLHEEQNPVRGRDKGTAWQNQKTLWWRDWIEQIRPNSNQQSFSLNKLNKTILFNQLWDQNIKTHLYTLNFTIHVSLIIKANVYLV